MKGFQSEVQYTKTTVFLLYTSSDQVANVIEKKSISQTKTQGGKKILLKCKDIWGEIFKFY